MIAQDIRGASKRRARTLLLQSSLCSAATNPPLGQWPLPLAAEPEFIGAGANSNLCHNRLWGPRSWDHTLLAHQEAHE
jgi:hypothetical protein